MSVEEQLKQQVLDLQERLRQMQPCTAAEPKVNAVAIKLTDFWEDKPKLWFAQAEAQFEIAGITQDSTKYGYILSKLDARLADEVEDVIADPPATGKYEHLKKELIRRLSSSKEQRVRKLLSEEQLGDRKPSAFLRHLRSLAGTTVGDEGIIRELWMRRLPPEVQRILTAQRDLSLEKVAEIADAIAETPSSAPHAVHAAQSPAALSELDSIKQALLELTKKTWVVSSILLFNVGCGMMNAPLTLDVRFNHADSSEKVDLPTSWKGTTEPLIIILGLLSSALLMHWFGRRTAFTVTTLASIISSCTIYFATTTCAITIGRMYRDLAVSGIFLGAIAIGEYASPRYRGVFLTLASASLEFGRITAYFIGNYKIIAMFAFLVSTLSFPIVVTWVESPYFLATVYKYDDCKKSFFWLRGTSCRESQELAKLIQKGKEDESKIRKKMGMPEMLLVLVKEVTTKKLLKPIVVIIFASILLGASGKTIFIDTYCSQIVYEILGKHSVFHISALHFAALTSVVLSSILIKVLKRRTLLFLTGFLSAILSFVISFTIFLKSNTIITFTTFVPLAMILFVMVSNICCSTIFLTWCGELFSLEHKSIGLVISGLIYYLNYYVYLKITPHVIDGLRLYGLFGLLAVLLTLSLLTLYFIAPETYNKTLLQIECYFENDDFESDDDEQMRDKDHFLVLTKR